MAKRFPLSQHDDAPTTASFESASPCDSRSDPWGNRPDAAPDWLQLLVDSASSEVALGQLLTVLAQRLGASACAVGILSRSQGLTQAFYWQPGQPPTLSRSLRPLLDLLELPAVRSPLARTELLSISNFSTLKQASALPLPPDAEDESGDLLYQWLPQVPTPVQESTRDLSAPIAADPDRLVNWSNPGSILVSKIRFQGWTNGVLVVLKSQPYVWTELDMQLLRTVSSQVSVAISQIQLQQQVQQQLQAQTLIERLTSAVRNAWATERIFQLALEGAIATLQVERGLVALYKYKDPLHRGRTNSHRSGVRITVESLFPVPSSTAPAPSASVASSRASAEEEVASKPSFQLSDCGLCQQVFAHPDLAIALPSYSESQCGVADLAEPIQAAEVFDLATLPSVLLVPLENQGTVLGILVVQQRQPRYWLPEEVAFLRMVAAQLSTAIIQTRTLRQVNSLVDERTAQLQRSLDVQAKLYEKTRQQVEQLRRLNQVMEEFLSTVSHELLTPLTSMKVAIRMLREANLAPEQRDRYLEILEAQCAQETRLINDLLTLQKLESQSAMAQFQQLDLQYVLRDLQEAWADSLAEQQMTLEAEVPGRPLMIRTDPDSLHRILTELLTNAKKYGEAGSKILLKASLDVAESVPQVVVSLTNMGAGIAPEEIPVIFEKFRRGQGATQKAIPGIGLGLALVKGLAAHLSGAIAVTSQPLSGADLWKTCFTLTLPQSPDLSR
ncbi:MAG TPA: HAMP domain-containing histidine kinase [Thermoleptolyngbya sp. M55_K2018_002]|nr:HAMP domain-containing histidine kinase [Thermoleptolyngbya sp. M55_K2018_002]